MWDQADIEGTAEYCYRVAGVDVADRASPIVVGSAIAGAKLPVIVTHGMRSRACLARVHSEWRVYLRPGLTKRQKVWLVWHEVAELVLRKEGYQGQDIERVANVLAGALRVPRRVAKVAGSAAELQAACDIGLRGAVVRLAELEVPFAD